MSGPPDKYAWHGNQFDEPKRSTVHLGNFVERSIPDRESIRSALDIATGAGANMEYLSRYVPNAKWVGIDRDEDVFPLGRERLDPDRYDLRRGDLYALEPVVGDQVFDLSFSIMTMSLLEGFEGAMEQMLAVTRGWIVIMSLFNPGDLDAFVKIRGSVGQHKGYSRSYNVYSLPRFQRWVEERGAQQVIAEPFNIDIDLDPPSHGGMESWTERLEDGRRVVFSGPMYLPWHFVAVRTPD